MSGTPEKQEDASSATVLIVGANRGIGLELARQYADSGWSVIGTAREPASAQNLQATGARVFPLDVTDQASVDQLITSLDRIGIDLLIVNAGIQKLMWTLDDIDMAAFEGLLRVNTLGPVRIICALLPSLRLGGQRKVVTLTSELASITDNTKGSFYGYRESKAALNMFTKSLAAELGGEGFVCVALHPGWVKTDMGGPEAPLDVTESVNGLRAVIDSLKPQDNGSYRTHSGATLPW